MRISCLEKGKRLRIPCKRFNKFNIALKNGILKKSGRVFKRGKYYFLEVYVEIPNKKCQSDKWVGLDSGMDTPIMTSDGVAYG